MKRLSILITALVLLFACKKDCSPNIPDDAEFLFSRYACMCISDCITGYKIEGSKLYKGVGANCLPENLVFEDQALDAAKVALAEDLRNAIPQLMLDENQEQYGCPDCGDWGGYYIELQTGEGMRKWRLDTQKDALPDDVRVFVEKLEQTFDALQ